MKIFIALALLAAGVASAQIYPTVTPLQRPILQSSYQEACTPGGFNADDSIYGICYFKSYGVCSGRGCVPTTHTTNYITRWDLNGNVLSASECDTVTSHRPQPATYVYYNGYTSCPVYAPNPHAAVVEPFYGPYSWDYNVFYFVAQSADGLYTLVDNDVIYPAQPAIPQS